MTSSDKQDKISSPLEDDVKNAKKSSKVLDQISPSNNQLTTVATQKKIIKIKKQCDSSEKNVPKHQYEGTKISFDPALYLTKQDTLFKMEQIKVERKDQRKQHYRKRGKNTKIIQEITTT